MRVVDTITNMFPACGTVEAPLLSEKKIYPLILANLHDLVNGDTKIGGLRVRGKSGSLTSLTPGNGVAGNNSLTQKTTKIICLPNS